MVLSYSRGLHTQVMWASFINSTLYRGVVSNPEPFDCFRGPLWWNGFLPETTLEKMWANNLANKSGKQRANKSWQTLGAPFLEVAPEPSNLRQLLYKQVRGNNCTKGGAHLFNATVLGSSLVSN